MPRRPSSAPLPQPQKWASSESARRPDSGPASSAASVAPGSSTLPDRLRLARRGAAACSDPSSDAWQGVSASGATDA
jgi:hypothetical protein